MLESPRLAALLKVFGTNLCHDIVGSDTDGELREIVRDTEKEAEEIARLVRQTVVDRFRYPYDVSLVMNREWGPWPLVGLLPFLLPNLREITFYRSMHDATFHAVRRLHECGRLPPLPALTTLTVERRINLPPEPTLEVLRLRRFHPALAADLRRLARAVGVEARFPRLRVVCVGVAGVDEEDPAEETRPEGISRRRWESACFPHPRLPAATKADIEELFGRAGVRVVFRLDRKWRKFRDGGERPID